MIPRVSIIVPVYNVEPYIKECLQSVAEQTIAEKIECLVVDDRGTDNSIAIAEKFLYDYSGPVEFRIITREKNGGLSAARNSGIREAKGEYLYFLDSDDYIIPSAMELLLDLADSHNGVDLISALYQTDDGRMDHFSSDAFPEFSDNQSEIKRALLDYDRIPVTAANRLISRSLIIDNDLYFKEGIIHEDNYWTFFLAKHVKTMGLLDNMIYYYRSTPGSIMTAKNTAKETLAFKTIIEDCTANIDSFEVGAQKKVIFLYLLMATKNKYYDGVKERNCLIEQFLLKNTLIERLILSAIFKCNYGKNINIKLINLIQKLYLKQ